MESSSSSSRAAKRMWHVMRVVLYMLGKGFSKDKFMMDLHLLLQRGKIAGKALGNLVTFHHHHHHHGGGGGIASLYSTLSCRTMDPNRSFYTPREVQFSCSNTPSHPFFPAIKRHKTRHHRRRRRYGYDSETVAKALEILRSDAVEVEEDGEPSAAASPASWWGFGRKSPAAVRQLRITDSPFPLKEEEEDGCIDQAAEEFIRQFYEELRLQQRIPVTPECSRPLMGRA